MMMPLAGDGPYLLIFFKIGLQNLNYPKLQSLHLHFLSSFLHFIRLNSEVTFREIIAPKFQRVWIFDVRFQQSLTKEAFSPIESS